MAIHPKTELKKYKFKTIDTKTRKIKQYKKTNNGFELKLNLLRKTDTYFLSSGLY